MLFATLIQLHSGSQCIYLCFPGVGLVLIHIIFFPSQWLLSHRVIVKIMISSERGMNHVATTIIYSENIQPSSKLKPVTQMQTHFRMNLCHYVLFFFTMILLVCLVTEMLVKTPFQYQKLLIVFDYTLFRKKTRKIIDAEFICQNKSNIIFQSTCFAKSFCNYSYTLVFGEKRERGIT